MPASLDELIKSDLDAYEKAEKAKKEAESVVTSETIGEDGSVTTTTTTTTTKVETVVVKKSVKKEDTPIKEVKDNEEGPATEVQTSPIEPEKTPLPVEQPPSGVATPAAIDDANIADPSTDRLRGRISLGRIGRDDSYGDSTPADPPLEKGKVAVPHDSENSVYTGLRVYTHKDVPVVIVGRLKPTTPAASGPSDNKSEN